MAVWPNGTKTKPYVSSGFGPRRAPIPGASTYHRGTDFSHTFGRLRAVAPGRVVVVGTPAGWSGGGTQVWIQHDGFFTRYLHMVAGSPVVRVGQMVGEDDDLGAMGKTGTARDVHLHFELTPGNVHYSNTGQVDPVPFLTNLISSPASGGGLSEGDDMPLDDNDRKFLIQLGADIVAQTKGPVQADLNSVHQSVLAGSRSVADAVAAIRADINYVHAVSPYSLKAILEASRGGAITLTDAQTKAIGGQLAAASVAGIDAALRDDFDGVKALLKRLPQETITALKSAL